MLQVQGASSQGCLKYHVITEENTSASLVSQRHRCLLLTFFKMSLRGR
jgi:hypothetical protein